MGAKTHTLSNAELPSHNHSHGVGDGFLNYVGAGTGGASLVGSPGNATTSTATGLSGVGGAHNIVQPSFVCRVAIRVR